MGKWEEHGLVKYQDYFHTKHWKDLKEDILFRRGTECWVCGTWVKLLLHHVSYKNLFKEKLYRDLYILCFDCHNRAHFWTIFKIKVPLTTNWLLFSLRLRKVTYCIRKRRFRAFSLWFLVILITVPSNIASFLLKRLFVILGRILWLALRSGLSKLNVDIR